MKIFNLIDSFLNRTPMYKLVIYALILDVLVAFILSFTKVLDYNPQALGISLVTALFVCLLTNFIFTKTLHLSSQYDSSIITALILFLVILPVEDWVTFASLVIASVLAIASKYIFVYRNTHIFNPAALGIYSATLFGFGTAFWWVGSIYLLPIIFFTGILIVRKTRRGAMFFAGLMASLAGILAMTFFQQQNFLIHLVSVFISGPIIFFLTIMVTEPHTITKNRMQQILYTVFIILLPIAFTFTPNFQIPPELSLLIANFISFFISERHRLVLKLKSINKLSDDIYEYNFEDKSNPNKIFNFLSGEYMEWNLDHKSPDDQGTRRYFTISSAPGTNQISLATKYAVEKDSSFKLALKSIKAGDTIFATQLGGDFLLPRKNNCTIVQIAGGIGVTPFVSQLRDLLNKKEKRNIILFYCVRFPKDIVYKEILQKAIIELNTKIVCIISENIEPEKIDGFFYEKGYLTKEILEKYIHTNKNEFYLSGPNVMVDMLKKVLCNMKVKTKNIHTDYFPGF